MDAVVFIKITTTVHHRRMLEAVGAGALDEQC
jgi:hypothetical protein